MHWIIYDAEGNEINRIAADEDFVKTLCEENGYTYELIPENPNPSPTLTYHQQNLIDDFNQMQSRIIAFIQDHSWATTRATFELAEKQYDAMVELYLVLADRIRYEGLESYVTID